MKKIALLFSIIVLASGNCLAQTSGFTYQGKLGDGGAPANGTYQFECKLYDRVGVIGDFGNQIGATQTVVATVQNGIFTMQLDFGAAAFRFGQERWLEIGVRLNGSNGIYTVFDPRQHLNSVPFAVRSLSAETADNAIRVGNTDPINFVTISDPRLTDARTPTAGNANYIQNQNGSPQTGNFTISGTGRADILRAETQFNIGGNRALSVTGSGSSLNSNTFAGVGAGASNTPSGTGVGGNNSSFFGNSAGSANTTGGQNSFFGSGAGFSNTEGFNNSFFGDHAGQSNTTGSFNSFFGEFAGFSNGIENNNTFIGANSNGAGGITNATAVGFGASVTQSNSLVLGSIINVNNATADTKVGIGTTAPLFKFHVKTGTDQDLVVRPGADFGNTTGIGLQSINDVNSVYQPLDLEGSQITMNVGSSGSVGIGTANPTFKLEVVDAANTGLRVQTNVAGGTVASFGGNGVFVIDAPGAAGGRLKVTESKLVSIPKPSGLILRSPNNTCWSINVSDTGVLSTTSVSCP